MMKKSKRFISALCALVVLISSYAGYAIPTQVSAAVASNPISKELQLDTKYDTFEDTDISVMSYNVLAHNGTNGTLEHYSTRSAKVVKMIETYNPDVIGIQEADVESEFSWPSYLKTELANLGYTGIALSDQTSSDVMKIANGLMMFYKTDRFSQVVDANTKVTNQGVQFVSTQTVDSVTDTDNTRWFQWVKLHDNKTGSEFYFYNTHLSINPSNASYTSAQKTALGHMHRTYECRYIADHIIKTIGANRAPFFVAGDFNMDFAFSNSQPLGGNKETLNKLIKYTQNADGSGTQYNFFSDAASVADYTRFCYPNEEIDHIFFSTRFFDAKEYHVAVENVKGRRTSDHSPQIGYFNYKGFADINGVETSERLYEAVTNTNSYTFNITLGSRNDVEIRDESGNLIASKIGSHSGETWAYTATLTKAINRFKIKFFDGSGDSSVQGKALCTVEAVVTNTSVGRPVFAPSGAIRSYFSNDAYHVLVNDSTNTLSLSASGAAFYTTANASGNAVTSANISAGRTVRYLKTTAGDVYPVYIYKETTTANEDSSVFYVDDDIGIDTGTVAYYDGKDVFFIQGGTKGFGSLSAVASKVTDGATVYFAPGEYTANNVEFNKGVTLLGSNHNVSAVNKVKPNWTLSNRNEESVIDGGLVFNKQGNISVTIKGFTFAGTSDYGPIYINDSTSDDATRITHVQAIDIQNNIFTGGGNGSVNGASALSAYSGAQVKGLIKNNYFRCTINQKAHEVDWVAGQTRGLSIKNPNGLEIDSNYFRGYELLGDFTDFISSSVAGNLNYAFTENRFEHCGTIKSAIKNIQSNTSANIVYYNNEVLRCGPGRRGGSLFFLDFDFNEGSLGNVCSNISITLFGNRFTDCYRVFTIQRALGTGKGNLAEIDFNMNKNSFINPTEGDWDGHEFFVARFNFYTGTSKTADVVVDWDLSDNYFTSPIFTDDYTVDRIINKATASVADFRKYRTDIPELNYIWNASKETNAIAPIKIDSNTFKVKEQEDYGTRADELAVVLNKATGVTPEYDEFIYDFNDDITGSNIATDELSSISDKIIIGTSDSGTVTVTADKTLELKGRTSFYTENRWDSTGQVSFDLKTSSTLLGSNRSAFHFKFGHWLSVANRELQNSDFYQGSNIEGCILTFATTTQGGPSVKLYVYHKTASGKAAAEYTFDNVVDSYAEFNTFKIVEAELGMIDLYANGKRFARLECYDNAATYSMRAVQTTADSYYDNVDVYAAENGALVKQGATITDSLVTKDSAVAFATSNGDVNNSGADTYGQTMEIDNLRITSNIDIVADDPSDDPIVETPGTITISNAKPGVVYNAYKMTDVTYSSSSDTYSYKIAAGWEEFFAGNGEYAIVKDVYAVNGGYVTRKDVTGEPDEQTMAEIARLAVKYAQAKGISPAGTATADANGNAVINVPTAGYYVVDSALGTLCSVGTYNGADANVNIQEKNDVPTLEKFVKEGSSWKKANDATIGDIVEFKILINTAKGAAGYALNDELAAGFKLIGITSVKEYASEDDYNAGKVKKTYTATPDYEYTTEQVSGNDSYKIAFADATIGSAAVGSIIEVIYRATVDADATIDDTPNVNTAYMEYGEGVSLKTVSVITNTYVWSFGIHKYYGNDISLPGASFELYTVNPIENAGAKPMQFVYDDSTDKYRVASKADIDDRNIPKTDELVSLVSGYYRIEGLDSATYYLVEKEAPSGFNKLGAPIAVTIESVQMNNIETQLTKIVTAKQGFEDVLIRVGDIIPVLNQTGIVLPGTGGYASVFVTVGCIMVMSMGVLLVVRKRMTKVIYIRNDDYYEQFDD